MKFKKCLAIFLSLALMLPLFTVATSATQADVTAGFARLNAFMQEHLVGVDYQCDESHVIAMDLLLERLNDALESGIITLSDIGFDADSLYTMYICTSCVCCVESGEEGTIIYNLDEAADVYMFGCVPIIQRVFVSCVFTVRAPVFHNGVFLGYFYMCRSHVYRITRWCTNCGTSTWTEIVPGCYNMRIMR